MTTEEGPVYKPRNTKDSRHPQEAGKRHGESLPQSLQHDPTLPTLPNFQTSGLQNGKTMYFYCFKPPSMCVIALGSKYRWHSW